MACAAAAVVEENTILAQNYQIVDSKWHDNQVNNFPYIGKLQKWRARNVSKGFFSYDA